ncbi:ABC transporter permease subunit [Labrys neptuniae]|uniref:ABC transporter permease n=1 Tax=Labrys neptuniae TaxID=376174 RepID=UPI00288E3E8B|nr:ABC transporter permease subunit [Labrys neptuniae]MDT3381051.1 ABC transporter permease subunit [Labrys neptuniae]
MSLEMLLRAIPVVLTGLKLTLLITLAAFAVGQLVALPVALGRVSKFRLLRGATWLYTFLLRGSPLLVQLFILYYGLAQFPAVRSSVFWPILRDPVYCAILAIGINSSAYVAEVITGGIRKIPAGQFEACISLGLSRRRTFIDVVLPQTYRAIFPSIGNEIILVLKASSLASAVTVMEMTGAARAFTAKTYAPFEVFIVAGLVYLLVGFVFSLIFRVSESALFRSTGLGSSKAAAAGRRPAEVAS